MTKRKLLRMKSDDSVLQRRVQSAYGKEISFVYGDQSFGRVYKDPGSKNAIHGSFGNTAKKIQESLDILQITPSELRKMTVLDIGTGRQAVRFQQLGAKKIVHFDISKAHILQTRLYCEKNNITNIESIHGDLTRDTLPPQAFDLIFASGIYQHIKPPHLGLINFAQSLKVGGRMYMGFYRSGDWRWFVVSLIREGLRKRHFAKIKNKVALYFSLGNLEHGQVLRIIDDFFVPAQAFFHPQAVIEDIESCCLDKYYIEDDFRDYCHDGPGHLSIGADRIYVLKKKHLPYEELLVKNFKTEKTIDQLRDIDYKDPLILENIETWLELVDLYFHGFIDEELWLDILINLYRLARPWNDSRDDYFMQGQEKGRHTVLSDFLGKIKSTIQS